MPEAEYKTLEVKQLTEEGQIEALISTFGRDRDGDVMTRDAFKSSDGKAIPMVWAHDWTQPVGKGVVSVSSKGAVFTGSFFLDTSAGEQAYRSVKAMGPLQEYSVGFRTIDADFGYTEDAEGNRQYTRTIKDLELFEASPVLVGAAYGTRTLAVKDAEPVPLDKAIAAVEAAAAELTDEQKGRLRAVAGEEEHEEEPLPVLLSVRERELKEIEAALGYRPLIAD